MKRSIARKALVVEGGGMRGIFAAGVLNAFGRSGFYHFDLYIGVSAGACTLASYLAGQHERNYIVHMKYSTSQRFINRLRFLKGGHYMDLDWLWDITKRESRLDVRAIFSRLEEGDRQFIVVATSLATGTPLYLQPDEYTIGRYLKISCSLPVLYRQILTASREMAVDGGIADPIPVI